MLTAHGNFKLSVDRVRDVADQIDREITLPLTPAIRSRHETLSCGSVVILSGYFETFLREIVKAYIRDVSALARPFINLPERLRRTHYREGSKVLHRVARGQARGIISTQEQILMRLQTVQHALPYELLWEAYADTRSNPGSETIREILGNCDIANPWGQIAVHSVRRRSDASLRIELDSFIAMRNECAHTGRPTAAPSTGSLRDYMESLLDISWGIYKSLDAKIASL